MMGLSARRSSLNGRVQGCPRCGQQPGCEAEAWALRVELATTWLVAVGHAGVEVARFCRACAPRGPIGEVACAACADGPLLAGALTTGPARSVVEVWLDEHGWRRTAAAGLGEGALLCPECAVFAVGVSRLVSDEVAALCEVVPAHDGQGRWTLW